MAYTTPTSWRYKYLDGCRNWQRNADNRRKGRGIPKVLRSCYSFPIDFLDDERLETILGVLVRERGLTQQEARVCTALMAGYTTNRQIAGRLSVDHLSAEAKIAIVYKKFGVTGQSARAALAALLWRDYGALRPRCCYLLPRLDPALLGLEPVNDREPGSTDHEGMAQSDRRGRLGRSRTLPREPQEPS